MGEDSGYFSRRSNEFRLPAHHRYNQNFANNTKKADCHCLHQQHICCCCGSSFDPSGSPRTRYYAGPSICDSDTTATTTIADPKCSSHYCQCDGSNSSNSSYNSTNTNNNNTQYKDRFSCPYHHHHHQYHHHQQQSDSQLKSPYTTHSPSSHLYQQQQTWNNCDPHNNNPSDILSSSPLSSERISHSSSLAYPGSGLPATNTSIASRSNSGYLRDDSTPASSVGNQSSSSSRVGRARFSPDDILKLGYQDLLNSPDLKRFSYGFLDEEDFEEFKQDLRDFQLSKRDPPLAEDALSSTQSSSSSGRYTDPAWSSFQRTYARETSTDRDATPGDNITKFVKRKDLTTDQRGSHHHLHQHRHLPTPNPHHNNNNKSEFCRKVEKESCDNSQSGRRDVVRNITFSSSNVDRLGRISGRDVLNNRNPNSFNSSSPSIYLPNFSPSSGNFSPLNEYGSPNNSFSPSPSSDTKHGSLSVKRPSQGSLPSFQHNSPSFRTTSAPHDMLMDFFKSDEHFQEFEREFANLGRDFDVFNRLRRIDDRDGDDDNSRPASRGVEPGSSSSGSATPIPVHVDPSRGHESSVSSGSCTPIPIHIDYRPGGGSREPTPRTELMGRAGDSGSQSDEVGSFFHPDDTFSDFFNNDEDFKEFEREFANFKLKRRSRAFADDFNRRSNCDLFADLFPGYEGQPPRERRSRGSASDWDYLFNKIKRNSNIFPEPSQCMSEIDANEDVPVFAPHPNDNRAPVAMAPPPYQEHPSENQPRTPRKAVEIAIQRRPPLPASPIRHLSPEVTRSPGLNKKKPLELRIEHISSPCSSPTCSSTSSPRTPTGPSFVPRARTDSPLLLHINEDELRDSPPIRRVLHFSEDSDENADEPTTPTNTDPTVLHIDEHSVNNDDDDDDGSIVIEHRFSEGFSTPTTTIRRRTKGSSSSTSERSASPASSISVHHQHSQPQQEVPSSELRERRRYTDPSRIVIERTFSGRDSEPDSSKQNRFSTALEFLHDEDADNSNHNDAQHQHDKDCQYTCHEKCRQLVTLDCKNSLSNSGSDGSIETSLSEPASTPGSNSTISDTSPNDETDSGYRSGPIPEEILPKKQPSQATLNREDLQRKLQEYNNNVPFANLAMESDGETFQGFIKVTLNLIRPITMSLGARPPSIYEVLTREHIVEQNTQSISFYMPRDTVKSIHVDSETTTKEVISALLKKFKILDNPRKFAMYEQQLNNGKIVKLRRVLDDEFPLQTCLAWGTENLQAHRLVLQENEATGDIEWSNFSLPELNNFLKVLDREQDEHIKQLQYKYRMMKKVILQRLKEIRKCRNDASPTSPSAPSGSNGNHSPGGQIQKVI